MHLHRRPAVAASLALAATLSLSLSGPAYAGDGSVVHPLTVSASYTGSGGYAVGVDTRRGLVYMAHNDSSGVTVLNESTGTATVVPLSGDESDAMAVDSKTGYAYIPGGNSGGMTVMRNGAVVATLPTDGAASSYDATVDPVRHLAYITGDNSVFVLSGPHLVATIPVGGSPYGIAVNPKTGVAYVPNQDDGTVSVIKNNVVVATVATGGSPETAGVDPLSGLVYIANSDSTVKVLEGTRSTVVKTIPVGTDDYNLAVNPVNHLVYVSDPTDNTVTIIRGTKVIATLDVPNGYDKDFAINPATGVVLVLGTDSVTAIHRTTVVGSVPTDQDPGNFALDDVTGRAFVATASTLMELQTPVPSSVILRRPLARHVYRQGTRKLVRYSCSAGVNNTVISCTGTRARGKVIPTKRLGRHRFTVRVRSTYGSVEKLTVHYRVEK